MRSITPDMWVSCWACFPSPLGNTCHILTYFIMWFSFLRKILKHLQKIISNSKENGFTVSLLADNPCFSILTTRIWYQLHVLLKVVSNIFLRVHEDGSLALQVLGPINSFTTYEYIWIPQRVANTFIPISFQGYIVNIPCVSWENTRAWCSSTFVFCRYFFFFLIREYRG